MSEATENQLEQPDPPGLSDAAIDKKHLKLRGSLKLKYPPLELSCKHTCGRFDLLNLDQPARHHRCVFEVGHSGECQFSSECASSSARV